MKEFKKVILRKLTQNWFIYVWIKKCILNHIYTRFGSYLNLFWIKKRNRIWKKIKNKNLLSHFGPKAHASSSPLGLLRASPSRPRPSSSPGPVLCPSLLFFLFSSRTWPVPRRPTPRLPPPLAPHMRPQPTNAARSARCSACPVLRPHTALSLPLLRC